MTYAFRSYEERSSSVEIKQQEKATGKQKLTKELISTTYVKTYQYSIIWVMLNLLVQHNLKVDCCYVVKM